EDAHEVERRRLDVLHRFRATDGDAVAFRTIGTTDRNVDQSPEPLLDPLRAAPRDPEVGGTAGRAPAGRLTHDAPDPAFLGAEDAAALGAGRGLTASLADAGHAVSGQGLEQERAPRALERRHEARGPTLRPRL